MLEIVGGVCKREDPGSERDGRARIPERESRSIESLMVRRGQGSDRQHVSEAAAPYGIDGIIVVSSYSSAGSDIHADSHRQAAQWLASEMASPAGHIPHPNGPVLRPMPARRAISRPGHRPGFIALRPAFSDSRADDSP